MTELNINDDNFNDLDNYDYLSITKLNIEAPNNINLLLDKLYIQIKEIKNLDKLVNLTVLNLSNNQIIEIKNLII